MGCGGSKMMPAALQTNCGCNCICLEGMITEGDTLNPVPEFAIAVADGQLVEVTITGYVIKTISNVKDRKSVV